jgi:hypothetical protein
MEQRIKMSQLKGNMSTPNKNGHLLLFSSNEWYKKLSHEELQKVIDQSKAWIERLTAQGKIKGGQALIRDGAIVSGKRKVVSDGPFAESKEAIGGFLWLNVETLEEAIAIAQTNPGLANGNSIEVRPVGEECPLEACARELAREEQLANA